MNLLRNNFSQNKISGIINSANNFGGVNEFLNATYLDGVDDHIGLGAILDTTQESNTFGGWLYVVGTVTSDSVLVANGGFDHGLVINNNDQVKMQVWDTLNVGYSASVDIPDYGEWFFVIGEQEGDNIRIFINDMASPDGTATMGVTSTRSAVNSYIGGAGTSRNAEIRFADVRIFNRILSTTEKDRWKNGMVIGDELVHPVNKGENRIIDVSLHDRAITTSFSDSDESLNDYKKPIKVAYGHSMRVMDTTVWFNLGADIVNTETDDYSLSAWIKPDTTKTVRLLLGSVGFDQGFRITGEGHISASLFATDGSEYRAKKTSGVHDILEHYLMVKKDKNVKLYVRGVLHDSNDVPEAKTVRSNTNWRLAGVANGVRLAENSLFADVRIFPRAIEDPIEIQKIVEGVKLGDELRLFTCGPQNDNLVTNPTDFSHADWVNYFNGVTRTSGFDDPDGGSDAWRLSFVSSANPGGIFQSASDDLVTQTCSVWLRCTSGTFKILFGLQDDRESEIELTTTWREFVYAGIPHTTNQRRFQLKTLAPISGSEPDIDIYHPKTEYGRVKTPYLTSANLLADSSIYGIHGIGNYATTKDLLKYKQHEYLINSN